MEKMYVMVHGIAKTGEAIVEAHDAAAGNRREMRIFGDKVVMIVEIIKK